MRWFRMYTEVVDDPKVQKLPGEVFKFWVNCLCLTRRNAGVLPTAHEIAWKMHVPEQRVSAYLEKLVGAGLIDRDDSGRFTPHNWSERQYDSDVSTPRVKRFRERQQGVSDAVSASVSVSVSVSEDFPRELLDPESFAYWLYARHPKRRHLTLVQQQVVELLNTGTPEKLFPLIAAYHKECCATETWQKEGGRYAPKLDEWLADMPWIGWQVQKQQQQPTTPRKFRDPLGDNVPEFGEDDAA